MVKKFIPALLIIFLITSQSFAASYNGPVNKISGSHEISFKCFDEIYYILSGNGFLQIGKKSYRIKEGQIYFVAKDIPHHFYGNTKNLSVLYFFGGNNS